MSYWRDDAACLRSDPELFFPLGTSGPALHQIDEAKRICQTCQVRQRCLAWALDSGHVSGIWGGATEEERHAPRQGMARRET
jgi:WhiB family redox-sensing transcriptional regulator